MNNIERRNKEIAYISDESVMKEQQGHKKNPSGIEFL